MEVCVAGVEPKKLNCDNPAGDVGLDVEFVVGGDVLVLVREIQAESRLREELSGIVGGGVALVSSVRVVMTLGLTALLSPV